MFQKVTGYLLLVIGILFGILVLVRAYRTRAAVSSEKGNIKLIAPVEIAIYFLATLGLSDYLLHTLEIRGMKLADSRKIPGTLVAAAVTPGAVMAFFMLQSDRPAGVVTIIACAVSMIIGTMTGGYIVGRMDGRKIRTFMGFALIGSLAALVIKMIVQKDAAGTLVELSGIRLIIAVLFSFVWGNMSMLGIPMKPAGTAVFLLLGLSPVATLTMTLVMGCTGPMGGAPVVYKRGDYHQKLTVCAVTFGSLGAVIGSVFALSVPAILLNILMMIMIVIAVISMLRPDKTAS
ncbi:MAG: hypothetical protein J6P87_00375 [Lachnospiraceae bacterium]|nr:hypothetical protein [Lachnospiraceae bacterium]